MCGYGTTTQTQTRVFASCGLQDTICTICQITQKQQTFRELFWVLWKSRLAVKDFTDVDGNTDEDYWKNVVLCGLILGKRSESEVRLGD